MDIKSEFNSICRLCLKESDSSVSIFQDNILRLLKDICDIEIKSQGDELPKNMCSSCNNTLKIVSTFIQQCKSSQNVLLNIMETESQIHITATKNLNGKECKISEKYLDQYKSEYLKASQSIKEPEMMILPKYSGKSDKQLLCNYCGKYFYIKINFIAHLRVHTGEKPFKCNECGKEFKQKSVLTRHCLNHLNVRPKPFACDVCKQCFSTKSHMNIHKRLHTGEKPYQCHFCQKYFNYRTHWKIHLRMHTGENPFICNTCNTGYHDKGSLMKHIKRKGHLPQITNHQILVT